MPDQTPISPCPFCGSDQVSTSYSTNVENVVSGRFVECENCAALGPIHTREERAITAWNTRTSAGLTLDAWRPIETAPKDGTEIWIWNGQEQARMKWIEGDGYGLWVWADELLCEVDPDPVAPTHWQPLPVPPLTKEG